MHKITNHQLDQLRELAAHGVFVADAARAVGLSNGGMHYWNERAHLGLATRDHRRFNLHLHPAPDIYACWRLYQTMQRLTEAARTPCHEDATCTPRDARDEPQHHARHVARPVNQMQAVLAKQPFETIADLILNFRHQVAVQIERIRTAQQAEMMPNPPSVETGE